jgi:hypothetical protein
MKGVKLDVKGKDTPQLCNKRGDFSFLIAKLSSYVAIIYDHLHMILVSLKVFNV